MPRTEDIQFGQLLYARKGETVLYYKTAFMTETEQGVKVSEGNIVGNYNRATTRPTGTLLYEVSWPSDSKNPTRFVKASQVEFTSFKDTEKGTGSNQTQTIPNTQTYDPVTDTNNIASSSDSSILYLGLGLAAAFGYKYWKRNN